MCNESELTNCLIALLIGDASSFVVTLRFPTIACFFFLYYFCYVLTFVVNRSVASLKRAKITTQIQYSVFLLIVMVSLILSRVNITAHVLLTLFIIYFYYDIIPLNYRSESEPGLSKYHNTGTYFIFCLL